MGYVADFITGCSIAEGDRAVGLVIVPNVRGWPDPVQAAAVDPTHPHDRFSPLSLPMTGFINTRGYFEPDAKQMSLDLLLGTVGFQSWDEFFEIGFDFTSEEPGFMLEGRRVIAGISAMHIGTYEALRELGTYEGNRESRAHDAASIVIDAQKRFREHRDDRSYFVSTFHSAPYDDEYETLSGEVITVPECSQALSEGHAWQVDRAVGKYIAKRFADADKDDGRELTQVYERLSDFQKLSVGMNISGKYFMPGGVIRHDNLYDVTKLQIEALKATLADSGARRRTGYEWADETFIEEMEAVSEQIRQLHGIVEDEISKAKAYFAGDNDEPGDEPKDFIR